MTREKLYQQYLYEVSSYEKYGSKNSISFDDWLSIKGYNVTVNITIDNNEQEHNEIKWLESIKDNVTENPLEESELTIYKELLGHTMQDIDTLE